MQVAALSSDHSTYVFDQHRVTTSEVMAPPFTHAARKVTGPRVLPLGVSNPTIRQYSRRLNKKNTPCPSVVVATPLTYAAMQVNVPVCPRVLVRPLHDSMLPTRL